MNDESNTTGDDKITSNKRESEASETIDDESIRKKQKLKNSPENENKLTEKHDGLKPFDDSCLVCFESGNEENPILATHNCSVCVADAWKICYKCNESLLSRQCPVCRSDYAPQIYTVVSIPPLASVFECDNSTKLKLIQQMSLVKYIMSKTNIAVWQPSESKMVFSFPQSLENCKDSGETEPGSTAEAQMYFTCKSSMKSDSVKDGQFFFSNQIWEGIILQSEQSGEGETLPIGKAFKEIVDATKAPGSLLLLPLPAEVVESIFQLVTEG